MKGVFLFFIVSALSGAAQAGLIHVGTHNDCLEINPHSIAVFVHSCDEKNPRQQFDIYTDNQGNFEILSLLDGSCVDTHKPQILAHYGCDQTRDQRFKINPNGVLSSLSHPDSCLAMNVLAGPDKNFQITKAGAKIISDEPCDRAKGEALLARQAAFAHPKKIASGDMRRESAPGCKKVDLSPNCPEVRNQRDIGWCFAAAAVDVLSCTYKKDLSFLDIGANLYRNVDIPLMPGKDPLTPLAALEGGAPSDALSAAQIVGICDRKDIIAEHLPDSTDFSYVNLFLLITEAQKKIQDAGILDKYSVGCTYARKLGKSFHGITPMDLIRFSDSSNGSSNPGLEMLSLILRKGCKKPFHPHFYWSYSDTDTDLKNVVNQQLDQGRVSALTLDWGNHLIGSGVPVFASDSPHAVVLVGRGFNPRTQRCEYLIRNSWGKDGNPYQFDIDTKDGYAWIPEDRFLPSLQEAISITPTDH